MLVRSAVEGCFREMEYSMSLLSMIALSLFAQDGVIRDALATVDDETLLTLAQVRNRGDALLVQRTA